MEERNGWTATELAVATLLFVLVSSLFAWEGVGWRSRIALDTAAWQVASDLRRARSRALAEGRRVRLVFDTRSDAYTTEKNHDGAYLPSGPPVPLPRGIDLVECTARDDTVTFSPTGTAPTFGTVVLENRGGEKRSVVVDIVGRVRIVR
ncbi:MAG: hypothetical protein KatS3mg076_1150 [Candidatus Binatia bacterium]|nr:MAG: hypothetical protein KatS3mg076_1150 [Candidatus Binatia bacterium]